MKTFYGHGKLLITGEYFLLDGGWGLALPTRLGQRMEVETQDIPNVSWTSYAHDGSIWFQQDFGLTDGSLSTKGKDATSQQLLKFLKQAQALNPGFLKKAKGYHVKTYLEFPREWGLGSSSTLIHLLSAWAAINPYQLLTSAFKGSGYDVAVAEKGRPLLYRWKSEGPEMQEVSLNWAFTNSLYFLHLNKKIESRKEIDKYRDKSISSGHMQRISSISKEIVGVERLEEFIDLIEEHERILSLTLETPTIKEQLFPDFWGSIKSLGAWGGDFVLVISPENPNRYFSERGYTTLIPYEEMIK